MNNARKIREMEKIYFYDTKEMESYSSKLKTITKDYDTLKSLCKLLVNSDNSQIQQETLLLL